MTPEDKIKVVFSPFDANPYQHLLADHLKIFGVEVFQDNCLSKKAFNFQFLSQFKIVHLHWLQPLYHDDNIVLCLIKSVLFYLVLTYLFFKKIPLVITMHNLLPHKMKFPVIDRFFRRKINKLADAIIFHNEKGKTDFINMFGLGRARHEVIPHGVYPESLVPLPSQKDARAYLKIPPTAETVCLFMGRAREQKGYDLILSQMSYFQDKNIHVVFAGADFTEERLKVFHNATILPYFIPDFEVPVLFAAADNVLLPYRSCTTSGLAVLAIGFGVPAVCSNTPYLKEICDQHLGLICDPLDPYDFAEKIITAKGMAEEKEYQASRSSFLNDNSWGKVAQKTFELYSSLR